MSHNQKVKITRKIMENCENTPDLVKLVDLHQDTILHHDVLHRLLLDWLKVSKSLRWLPIIYMLMRSLYNVKR